MVQLVCLAACWGMRFTGPFSLAFPLVVVGFIPLRLYVLPKLFTKEELDALDSEDAPKSSTTRGMEDNPDGSAAASNYHEFN
eukprot:CAMPEP_0198264702 /NCGR_PEP_ID=MMETSP1447-20131203/16774_1 /TAXON_ID=420782 /ORGANISM="Chaetoceros dichaeta, Strain CCMP1751" /LENGTH=81 /DNA_ID=CAMNT_0043953741 /DNA_START=22 /DNA_END=267 /DNA_ORIENTATION=-